MYFGNLCAPLNEIDRQLLKRNANSFQRKDTRGQYKGGTSDYGLNRSPGEQLLQ